MITIKTSLGDIECELFEREAPETVGNFLKYVDSGHYRNTVFHRVIENFMIQGGGFDADFQQKTTDSPVRNEADNRISNKRGTIAMARTMEPHSATSQFFINVKDNGFLDFQAPTPQHYGYCVFGKVTNGMETIDAIEKVKTGNRGVHSDVPEEDVIIYDICLNL